MDFNTKNKNLQPIGNENLKECLNKPTEKKLLMSDFIGFMEDKNLKLVMGTPTTKHEEV